MRWRSHFCQGDPGSSGCRRDARGRAETRVGEPAQVDQGKYNRETTCSHHHYSIERRYCMFRGSPEAARSVSSLCTRTDPSPDARLDIANHFFTRLVTAPSPRLCTPLCIPLSYPPVLLWHSLASLIFRRARLFSAADVAWRPLAILFTPAVRAPWDPPVLPSDLASLSPALQLPSPRPRRVACRLPAPLPAPPAGRVPPG